MKADLKKIGIILLFVALAFVGYRLNFSSVVGAEAQYFTFFQFLGPIVAGILGPLLGSIAILGAELMNMVFLSKEFTFVSLLRLLPMVFAGIYFAKSKDNLHKLSLLVPLICIAAFIMHPVGKEAWIYSLFWLIPVGAYFLRNNLFFRALGATFTAHGIGSVIWMYSFSMPAQAWIGLIPVTAIERLLFATGISLSFIALNTVLVHFKAEALDESISVEKEFSLA